MSITLSKNYRKLPKSLQKTGLTERDWNTLAEIFDKFESVNDVRLFGSRAMGNFKSGSDIDLAVMNEGVEFITEIRIKGECEDSSLPYFVDIANYPRLQNQDFKDHIDRVSIPFYKKSDEPDQEVSN